jgi:hypothetical protein
MVERQYFEYHFIDHFHENIEMRIFYEFDRSDLLMKLLQNISLLLCRKVEVTIEQKIKRANF